MHLPSLFEAPKPRTTATALSSTSDPDADRTLRTSKADSVQPPAALVWDAGCPAFSRSKVRDIWPLDAHLAGDAGQQGGRLAVCGRLGVEALLGLRGASTASVRHRL
jgi:hypothetical protein